VYKSLVRDVIEGFLNVQGKDRGYKLIVLNKPESLA
jgi:hypothetical protein